MSGVFLNENSINIVASRFQLLKTVKDLAVLLNFIESSDNHPQKGKLKSITEQDLRFLVQTKESRYGHFVLRKKSGGEREIKTPDDLLKRIQRLLNCLLQIVFLPKVHYSTNGFIYGRDIIRNAKPHVNKKYVFNCDIKDFFPSINFRRIKTVLELSPFNFVNEREHLGFLIANLCVHEDSLPQGAPTSPLLSNIVTQRLDRKITKYSLSQKVKYSRYADDLTFSSNKNVFDSFFLEAITNIIKEENFDLNTKKTRLKTDMERQQVTGLVVNQKINIKREYIQKTRAMLNNWEKGGLEFAKRKFRKHQIAKKKNYDFIEVVSGHVSFIGNVKGKDNYVYQKLQIQLSTLRLRIDYRFIASLPVRKRLMHDNIKMEKILLDKIHINEDKFISFCTSAFHQIENLLNYYYWKRFPDIIDLLNFLLLNNENFKKSFKNIEKAKTQFVKIRDLNINHLVYIFEKEFYYETKSGFYDRRITKLREIRNDESHRCSVIESDKEKIVKEYRQLKDKKEKYYAAEKKYLELGREELKIELKFHVLEFLEKKDFGFVRKIVNEVAMKIKIQTYLNLKQT